MQGTASDVTSLPKSIFTIKFFYRLWETTVTQGNEWQSAGRGGRGGFDAQQKEQNEGVKDLAGRILAITEFWKQMIIVFSGIFFSSGCVFEGSGLYSRKKSLKKWRVTF